MKLHHILYFTLVVIFTSCGKLSSELLEEGVSYALAEHRNSTIFNVRYDLHFEIPEQKEEEIRAEENIYFEYDSNKDLVLDFCSDKFSDILVNGEKVQANYINEHIVIPASFLNRGSNIVSISFVPEDRPLNRNDEYLYSLFVPAHARSVFPCFDQPDMKANFELSLQVPEGWTAVSNTAIASIEDNMITFAQTELLPTYLFSFVAGKWEIYTSKIGDMSVSAYYRETDPDKIAQLPEVFEEVESALNYLEEYTGIKMPFSKYDFVIVPGFQFGGMEHPGAILYNENTIFLNNAPTIDEREKRKNLIAHETAHLWFGDMVTMKWFNDVWTKEVYANYFAAEMVEPMFPEINHEMVWMKNLYVPAMNDDRTRGSVPIRQELDNLVDASLIYGNIIYDKAPIMMRNLVEYMGKDNFRRGIQEYLANFAYSNATWDDLIEILDSHTEKDLKTFSDAWVYMKSMPEIYVKRDGDKLIISQNDPLGRSVVWPQKIQLMNLNSAETKSIELDSAPKTIAFPEDAILVPNSDGRTYGIIILEDQDFDQLVLHFTQIKDETARAASLLLIHENYIQRKNIKPSDYLASLLDWLKQENNPQIASSIISQLSLPLTDMENAAERGEYENIILQLSQNHENVEVRNQLLKLLANVATSSQAIDHIYGIWQAELNDKLSVNDYMNLSWQLAIRKPELAHDIVSHQRSRLDGSDADRVYNSDRLRQYDFISRAVAPQQDDRDEFFNDLLRAENRTVEPWVETAMALLNHSYISDSSVKYIRPALDSLQDVKNTGDIFFPASWCRALFSGHRSEEAYEALNGFIEDNSEYSKLLINKILLNSYYLERSNLE